MIKKLALISIVTLLLTFATGYTKVLAAPTIKVNLQTNSNNLQVNQETEVNLVVTTGTENNINAFSFYITAPNNLQLTTLTDQTQQEYFIKHFQIVSNNTNNTNNIQILAAKNPDEGFTINPNLIIAKFKVKSATVGTFPITFKSDFSHSILNTTKVELLDKTGFNTLNINVAPVPTPTPTPTPIGALVQNVVSFTNRSYKYINEPISNKKQYTDRNFIINNISPEIQDLTFIQTANDDKRNQSTNILSFDLTQKATIYVAHDRRYAKKPTWLNTWAKTDYTIKSNGAGTFDIFQKTFNPQNIVLGSNINPQENENNSMYFVLFKP